MLRIMGGIMIVSGCTGLGLWYRQQFLYRLKSLRKLDGILELFMSEIRYGKATLPECCRRLSEHLPEPYGSCFRDIFLKMQENTGESFGEVFQRYMKKCLSSLPLTKEDEETFLHFTKDSSFAEGKMQLRAIEQSRELLGEVISQLQKEIGEKCRMAVGLGAMSGLLLLIVLL